MRVRARHLCGRHGGECAGCVDYPSAGWGRLIEYRLTRRARSRYAAPRANQNTSARLKLLPLLKLPRKQATVPTGPIPVLQRWAFYSLLIAVGCPGVVPVRKRRHRRLVRTLPPLGCWTKRKCKTPRTPSICPMACLPQRRGHGKSCRSAYYHQATWPAKKNAGWPASWTTTTGGAGFGTRPWAAASVCCDTAARTRAATREGVASRFRGGSVPAAFIRPRLGEHRFPRRRAR